MQNRLDDVVIDEVRAARRLISARFDHDPERLVAYYQELQKRYADRLLEKNKAKEKKDPSAA
jgi:hypothetical protein